MGTCGDARVGAGDARRCEEPESSGVESNHHRSMAGGVHLRRDTTVNAGGATER
jgi:hypothetical protein